MFGVFDWAGNRLFDCKTFNSFEAAWDHIYKMVPNEDKETYCEFEALPLNELDYGYSIVE